MVECTARLRPGFESRPGRMVDKTRVSLEEFVELCKDLAAKIQESKFKPDIIIGISKGGWVPARFLSDYLGIDSTASVACKSYHCKKKTQAPEITEKLSINIKGANVLVVDDIADSGETILVLKDYLASFKPAAVKFATLHYKPWSKAKPDYYIEETNAWIVYPWEFTEDSREN